MTNKEGVFNMTNYMTTIELAEKYKVSRQAIDRWRERGLPYIKLGKKSFRYDEAEVHRFLVNQSSKRVAE